MYTGLFWGYVADTWESTGVHRVLLGVCGRYVGEHRCIQGCFGGMWQIRGRAQVYTGLLWGYVADMWECTGVYRVVMGKYEGKKHLEDLGIDRRKILK